MIARVRAAALPRWASDGGEGVVLFSAVLILVLGVAELVLAIALH